MLSNPLHRFSPYHNLPSSGIVPNGHMQQAHMHSNGLDTLGAPGYTLQQLQHVNVPNPHLARAGPQPKHRQHPYAPNSRSSGSGGPIRRRISRACDQCNQLRTKCDGQHPCAHCIEFGLGCDYVRERKKRGKASRKDLAAQAAAQASATGSTDGQQTEETANEGSQQPPEKPSEKVTSEKKAAKRVSLDKTAEQSEISMNNDAADDSTATNHHSEPLDGLSEMPGQPHLGGHAGLERDHLDNTTGMDLAAYGSMHASYERQSLNAHLMSNQAYVPPGQGNMPNYPDLPYAMQAQSPPNYSGHAAFRMGNSPLNYAMGGPASPGWGMSMPSPTGQFQQHVPNQNFNNNSLRYPVLEPLLPHLGSILPIPLACDLIELYFASSSSAHMHPMSPYVLGYVFRKRSFLHPTRPRQCQPALLSSMLWVAAQTSDAPFLTSVPSARGKVCQKLLELTVGLLKPLIHTPSGEVSPASSPVADGVALGGLGVALPGTISMDALTGATGAFGAAGKLDDVVTYIHLATVVSASEYKGASLRWWNAAWSLARELKLGRELPLGATPMPNEQSDFPNDGEDEHDLHRNDPSYATEEEREERRRIWWLVYTVDRHLALCYNRPLFLLDIECDGLLQPMDDSVWQNGDFRSYNDYNTDPNILNSVPEGALTEGIRARGPHFECRGHSIFGYFLPLMTILGEIVDLHHARNHPRFGVGFRSAREWDDQAAEITRHLEAYEQSLKRFEMQHLPKPGEEKNDMMNETGEHHGAAADIGTPSVHSVHTNSSNRMTESDIQTRIVIAYGTHVMHVLHILLAGKWDPINLLDDNDLWISSQGFITSTSHAVAAAEAISHILEFDPGLEFMPFFFGIYLLQGSFLLLLIADKLQSEASPSVVKACETITRAHEACVVTLNTEYQRNFSKVMRSALAQVRGRVPEDLGEQHQRRRELLALYRWTGDGTGLAL